jgi:hypothetical protein
MLTCSVAAVERRHNSVRQAVCPSSHQRLSSASLLSSYSVSSVSISICPTLTCRLKDYLASEYGTCTDGDSDGCLSVAVDGVPALVRLASLVRVSPSLPPSYGLIPRVCCPLSRPSHPFLVWCPSLACPSFPGLSLATSIPPSSFRPILPG